MEEIEITREEALTLHAAIMAAAGIDAPFAFSYALARTKKSLQPERDAFDEADQASREAAEALAITLAQKDDDGKPVMTPDGRGFLIDPQHADQWRTAETERQAEIKALLHERIKVAVYRVTGSMPETLSPAIVEGLLPILPDD